MTIDHHIDRLVPMSLRRTQHIGLYLMIPSDAAILTIVFMTKTASLQVTRDIEVLFPLRNCPWRVFCTDGSSMQYPQLHASLNHRLLPKSDLYSTGCAEHCNT